MQRIFKERHKIIVLLTIIIFVSVVFSGGFARSKEIGGTKKSVVSINPTQVLPFPQQRAHRMSEVNACMTNWGLMGSGMRWLNESMGGCFNPNPNQEVPAPSFEFPPGSGLEYLFHGGIWIGAIVNDSPYTSVGCDGWFWIYELWPDSEPQGAIMERSTKPTAPCFSTGAISHQDVIAVYTDTSADTPLSPARDPWDNRKHFPLDVRITQKTYSWNIPGFDKFVIAEYIINNIGSHILGDLYFGFYLDTDIMHIDEVPWGGYAACDDITGFLNEYEVFPGDTQEVNIAWAADNDGFGLHPPGVWDSVSLRSVIGVKVLRPPRPGMQMSYNWWTSDARGLPYDWGPWRAANQTIWQAMNPYQSGNLFPDSVLGTPGGDVSKYFIMSNQEVDYDQIYSCVWPSMHPEQGWLPPNDSCSDFADGKDIRFLISFGPFDEIGPGESLLCVLAYVIGESLHVDPTNGQNLPNNPDTFYAHLNFSSLVQNAQIAQELYNDNFLVFFPGDVTSDQIVDIADIVSLINYLFIGGPSPSPLKAGDVNRDCEVDIEDVLYLINYLFLNGPPPQVGCA